MIQTTVADKHVLEAISLGASECFGAMNIANALGGSQTVPWEIVRKYSLAELVADALDRGLDVRSVKAAVDQTPFLETKAYLRVRDEIGGRPDFPA